MVSKTKNERHYPACVCCIAKAVDSLVNRAAKRPAREPAARYLFVVASWLRGTKRKRGKVVRAAPLLLRVVALVLGWVQNTSPTPRLKLSSKSGGRHPGWLYKMGLNFKNAMEAA